MGFAPGEAPELEEKPRVPRRVVGESSVDNRMAPESSDDPEAQLEALKLRVLELEDALAARDEFISVIGHELKNPLSPLFMQIGQLSLAARRAPEGQVSSAWLLPRLDSFSKRLDRFLSTLNRILDVTRLSAGHLDLVPGEVDLAEVVRELCEGMARELAVAGSTLTISGDEHLVGEWDRMRVEQILGNLLSNAVRYGSGQPISVSFQAVGAQAVLTVRDHGVGIADADQERIFQRFERAGRRSAGGFGVGLWLVKKLCLAMGGSVSVKSRPGEGATFTVTLPRHGKASP